MQLVFAFLGRICVSSIFIFAAAEKFFNWSAAQQRLVTHITDWITYASQMPSIQKIFTFLLPHAEAVLVIATVFEALGGLLVFLGMKVKLGAGLLIFAVISTMLFFHAFWMASTMEKSLQMTMFFQNLAILGGLFFILSGGVEDKSI